LADSIDRRGFLDRAAGAWIGLSSRTVQGGAGSTGWTAGSTAAHAAVDPEGAPILPPRVNGGINIQPVRRLDMPGREEGLVIAPELVALQLQAVYALGFDAIRITAPHGDRRNFLAAVPYVRAARALGIDALVVLSNFAGFTSARVLWDAQQRRRHLELYDRVFTPPPPPAGTGEPGLARVGEVALQILNEPTLFFAVPPDVYVREILRPSYEALKRIHPGLTVVSAADVGTPEGVPRVRAMFDAGLEDACDRIAYHVYDRSLIPLLSPSVRNAVWITESGAEGTSRHLGWVRETFPEIQARIPGVSRIFYFQLFDTDPGRFRLIDIEPEGASYRAVVESVDLHAHFAANVSRAAGGDPLLPFEVLVPDVRAYFPTAEDAEAYDGVFLG